MAERDQLARPMMRRPDSFKPVAVALANKMARIAFAILRGKTVYREIPA